MQKKETEKHRRRVHISRRNVLDLCITTAIVAVTTGASALLVKWTDSSANVTALYMLAVLLVARTTEGYGWGILASVMGVFAVNYAFTDPFYKLNFTATGYPVIFISLLLISIITSATTGSVKEQARRSRASEQRICKLYEFSQQLANAHDTDSMIDLTLRYLHELLGCPVLFFQDEDSLVNNQERVCGQISGFVSDSIERGAVEACFREKSAAGAGTMLAPYAMFHYIPLMSGETMLGCYGIQWKDNPVDEEMMEHIRAILAQTGISLERQMLAEERNRAALAADREMIRSNLLRSISHDLRTPLTGIIGASAAIEESGDRTGAVETKKLAADIHEDAEWLLRMVENLLSVTRVSQVTNLKKSEEAAEEVIAEAVARCKKRYPDAQISVHLPEEMLFVPMDVTLIVQVLINLIENAIRYAGTPVDVSLCRQGGNAQFSVRDFGPGIPKEQRDTLFETTQVHSDSRRGGLGIGLTLCRSIIIAHEGKITENNHPDGGAQFVFTLPMEENA